MSLNVPRVAIAMAAVMVLGQSFAAVPSSGESAVIVNSGSTNAPGFRIVVMRSGDAKFTLVPRRNRPADRTAQKPIDHKIPDALVARFYSDLEAATPFSALPLQQCIKSVSFGTRLTVEFNNQETPDISCGRKPDPRIAMLREDVDDIVNLFPSAGPL
jgi:hypothetical protein